MPAAKIVMISFRTGVSEEKEGGYQAFCGSSLFFNSWSDCTFEKPMEAESFETTSQPKHFHLGLVHL